MQVYAIIVAAGTGSRTGRSNPKQFELLAGKPVYRWSADVFDDHAAVARTVLVLPPHQIGAPVGYKASNRLGVTKGGKSRSASVLNGLESLHPKDDDIVLIHDAARPGITAEVVTELIGALQNADAAAPALPISDALKREEATGLMNVPRDRLFRVQTPQAFRAGTIKAALKNRQQDFVDDLAAVEAMGARIVLTAGRERLHKVTYEDDFQLLEALLRTSEEESMRVGTGFDVHAFEEGEGVWLCGILVPHDRKLAGHSDADVGWHALTDAILGALALGDIGDHFPPSDPQWKGADSAVFLKHAINLANERGYDIQNCDITLICEAPKVKPHRDTMRERTAEVMGVSVDTISIKATTTEGLGFAGRREGIAAQAVVMLSRKSGK